MKTKTHNPRPCRLGHESRATTRARADTHDAEIARVVYRTRGFP